MRRRLEAVGCSMKGVGAVHLVSFEGLDPHLAMVHDQASQTLPSPCLDPLDPTILITDKPHTLDSSRVLRDDNLAVPGSVDPT